MNNRISSWTFGHAILMLMTTAVAIYLDAEVVLILPVIVSVVIFIIINRRVWMPFHPAGGFANQTTLLRFALLVVAVAMQKVLPAVGFTAMIIGVMIADGLDGYLARKFHQSTDFGEVFDMEVDAFLALSLTFLIWDEHPGAVWVLGAGLLRYLFVIVYRVIRWHGRRRPAMPEAKVLAVFFFISLLTPLVFDWYLARWIVGLGCVLVTYSFVKEFFLISKE